MAVLTPDDVRPYLNKESAADDGKLDGFIAAAEAMLAQRCGPLEPTATTSVVPGSGTCQLVLPVTPVLSVTSVTGRTGGVVTLVRTSSAGVAYADAPFSEDYYTAVYSAGRTTCPADLKQGIAELVRHLWVTQRGGGGRTGSPIEDVAGGSYSLPRRVEQLIAPHLQFGFA